MDKSANTVLGERKVQKRCRRTSRRHEAIETKNEAARDASEAMRPRWNLSECKCRISIIIMEWTGAINFVGSACGKV